MRRAFVALLVIAAALWLNNSSWLVQVPDDQMPRLLAHRGVHQIYAGDDRTNETCSASPIAPPRHSFIANTLPSIHAAFENGADVVELDLHLTTDGVFAVFHDWTLECQTNGTGVTHEQSFAYLRGLDLGYGYSADGKSYPLRGTGVGLMPSLTEVLQADLGGQILINFKSNRAFEGRHLAALLDSADYQSKLFGVYGGQAPTRAVLAARDDLRGFDRSGLKTCLITYALVGWSGYVPKPCQDTLVAVPMDYGKFMWGWPHRFTKRMKDVGTTIILWGPYDGSGFSSGIDGLETVSHVPKHFDGLIWTNRIEVIGPHLQE